MDNIYAVIFVNNDIEQGMATVESIRAFNDIEGLSVIVVDNTNGARLSGWAKQQQDITYVYMDGKPHKFSELYNSIISELNIDGDMLLIDEGMAITPNCLKSMKLTLDSDDHIGAVGGVSNGFAGKQNRADLNSYEKTIDSALSYSGEGAKKRSLNLDASAILWKKETIKTLGEMDEKIDDKRTAMFDYCIRAILANWKLVINPECLWWDIQLGHRLEGQYLQVDKLEKKWGMHYFNWTPNYSLVDMIDKEKWEEFSVLEVGCDCGATLLEIENSFPNAKAYGSELNPNAVKVAMHVANVVVDNIENQNLLFPGETFNYIIFGDVLEHLRDPQATVDYCRTLLKDNGCIIACIPNLMHVSVMRELLNGRFEYTEMGLLDRTHVHFFTYYEIINMFQKAGYEVEIVSSRGVALSEADNAFIENLLALSTATEKFMYETFQYIIRARIKDK